MLATLLPFQVSGCTNDRIEFITVTVTSVVKLGSLVVFHYREKKRLDDCYMYRQILDESSAV